MTFIVFIVFLILNVALSGMSWSKTKFGSGAPVDYQSYSVTNVGGTFFVIAGCIVDSKCTNKVYNYDPMTSGWTEIPTIGDKPDPRGGHIAVKVEKEIYVFGGHDEFRNFNDIFRFDTEKYQWTRGVYRDVIPLPRSYHAAVSDGSSKFYVYGGYLGGGSYSDEMMTFDVAPKNLRTADVGTFNIDVDMVHSYTGNPPPRELHSMLYLEGFLYMYGGHIAGKGAVANDFWRYEIKSNSWSKLPGGKKIPQRRAGQALVRMNSKIFLFGGCDPSAQVNSCHEDTWFYDVQNFKWEQLSGGKLEGGMNPTGRWKFAGLAYDGYLFAMGGSNLMGRSANDAWYTKIGDSNSITSADEEKGTAEVGGVGESASQWYKNVKYSWTPGYDYD